MRKRAWKDSKLDRHRSPYRSIIELGRGTRHLSYPGGKHSVGVTSSIGSVPKGLGFL